MTNGARIGYTRVVVRASGADAIGETFALFVWQHMKEPTEQLVELAALSGVKVDKENFVIFGASICTVGPAKGRGCECDSQTLSQIKKLCDAAPDGLPVRDTVGHDGAKIGDTIGVIKNARLDGGKLRGDIHILATHPAAAHYLELAEKLPSTFGLSINGKGFDEKSGGKVCKRIVSLSSVDLVEKPAANPDGLLCVPCVEPVPPTKTMNEDQQKKIDAAKTASEAAYTASADATKNHTAEAHQAACDAHRAAASAHSDAGQWQTADLHRAQCNLHSTLCRILSGGQLSQPPAAATNHQPEIKPMPDTTPAPATAAAPAPAPTVEARLSAIEAKLAEKPADMEAVIVRAFTSLFAKVGVDPAKFSAAPTVEPPTPAAANPAETAKTFAQLVDAKMSADKCSKADAIRHCVRVHPVEFAAAKAAGSVIL